jgi:hypothetical protein
MILNGDIDPKQVLEFQSCEQHVDYNAGEIKWTVYYDAGEPKWKGEIKRYYNRFTPTSTTRPGLPRPGFENPTPDQIVAYDSLVLSAIASSRWILPENRNEVFERFRTGDQDAAGLILLPLLIRLKAVEPPIEGGLCAGLFRQVALETRRSNVRAHFSREGESLHIADRQEMHNRDDLPFSDLAVFYLESDYSCSEIAENFRLDKILPFLSIPSLRRIVLHGMRDWNADGWPIGLPPISCSQIYFAQSSLHQDIALEFAKYMSGPSTLIQWYELDNWNSVPSERRMGWFPNWDHLHVDITATGERRVWTSLQYNGGVHRGDELPWVSWLWHGKMQDWEMLDEPFRTHEGDEDVFELTGAMYGC